MGRYLIALRYVYTLHINMINWPRFDGFILAILNTSVIEELYNWLRTSQIANICDRGYIGPERTLFTFAPLLQPKAQNPKANILMLFLKAAKEIENELGTRYQAADLPRRMERLTNLIGVDTDMMARIAIDNKTVPYDLGFFCRSKLHARFADFDELFDLFLRAAQMDEFEKANRVKTKRQHSLVEKWTYRVTNRTSKKDFDSLRTEDVSGWEC